MWATLAAAQPWLVPAAALLWGWGAQALWSAFWALRLGVYAVSVWVAWESIIEEGGGAKPSKGSSRSGLSHEALRVHNARGGGSPRGRRSASPSASEASVDSIDEWSIFEGEEGSEGVETASESEAGAATPAAAPQTPAVEPRHPAAAAPVVAHAAAAPPSAPHPPVTATHVPTPAEDRTSLADAVLPAEVAAVAADSEEKQALAGAAVATGATTTAAADSAAAAARKKARKKGPKQPWLNRKVEALFAPYQAKYTGASYMVYKGFSGLGKRMERGSATLGKQLNGAIRSSGAEAVQEVEGLMKKWVKFFGLVAFLTIALLPLPSVHITLVAG